MIRKSQHVRACLSQGLCITEEKLSKSSLGYLFTLVVIYFAKCRLTAVLHFKDD